MKNRWHGESPVLLLRCSCRAWCTLKALKSSSYVAHHPTMTDEAMVILCLSGRSAVIRAAKFLSLRSLTHLYAAPSSADAVVNGSWGSHQLLMGLIARDRSNRS